MNIFYLDSDPIKAAQYQCDKHVVKMALESAQLLCTAHSVLDRSITNGYTLKPTHINHPSSVWVRQSSKHYSWLYDHLKGLCAEYTRRYEKVFKIEEEGLVAVLATPPRNLSDSGFTAPPQCMLDFCKVEGDTVSAYRKYYLLEKVKFAKWKLGDKPPWWWEEEIVFTVGKTDQYDKYIDTDPFASKLGRDNGYDLQGNPFEGGSVWQTFAEAWEYVTPNSGYSVYGVLADWKTDVVPSLEGPWGCLFYTSKLVKLN